MKSWQHGILAAAIAAAACGVSAADIQIYGLIDASFGYAHKDNGTDTTNTFQMLSGPNSQSRFGFKGTEKISDTLSVGFVLENGFDVDTGAMGNGNRLFGREAQVNINGSWGTLKLGRMGAMTSGLGTTGIFGGTVSAFPSAKATSVPNHKYVMGGAFAQYDNVINYNTPVMGGFQIHAQYSSARDAVKVDAGGRENSDEVNRYAALGVTYAAGPLKAVAVVDQQRWKGHEPNGYTVNLGGQYDFGAAKVFVAAERFAHTPLTVSAFNTGAIGSTDKMTGWGLISSVAVPVAANQTVKFGAGYMTAEADNGESNDVDRWAVVAGYQYRFTKRTQWYITGGMAEDSYGKAGANDGSCIAVESGIIHRF